MDLESQLHHDTKTGQNNNNDYMCCYLETLFTFPAKVDTAIPTQAYHPMQFIAAIWPSYLHVLNTQMKEQQSLVFWM
jgi:hypothetical protein